MRILPSVVDWLERTVTPWSVTSKRGGGRSLPQVAEDLHNDDSDDVNQSKMKKLALISDLKNAEVSRMGYIYEAAPEKLKTDKDVVLVMVSKHGLFIEKVVPKSFQNDPEVVLAAVMNYGGALKYVNPCFRDNKEFVKVAVQSSGFAINAASDRLKSDREIALLAVKNNGSALQYCDPKFRGDREFALAAIESGESYSSPLKHFSEDLKRDRDIILRAVSKNGKAIEHAPLNLVKDDREIMLAAVKTYGEALGYASGHLPKPTRNDPFHGMCGGDYRVYERYWAAHPDPVPPKSRVDASLADDREIVLTAVTQSAAAFEYASDRLKNDKEIAIEAVKKGGFCLEYASESLKDDPDVVLASVIHNGDSLKCASKRLQRDGEIVATALACCDIRLGSDLQPHYIPMENASRKVFDHEEAALVAIVKWRPEQVPISPRLQADKSFALKAVSFRGDSLRLFDSKIRKDRQVVEAALAQSGTAARFSMLEEESATEKWIRHVTSSPLSISDVPKDTPNYIDIVLAAIAVDGKAFKYVFGTSLNDDKDFILKAVQIEGENTTKNNRVLELASPRLRDDREVVLAGVRRKPASFARASARLRNDPEIALLAARESYGGFSKASNELRANKQVVMEAIKANPGNIQFASPDLQGDLDVAKLAVAGNGAYLRVVSSELQSNRALVLAAVSSNGFALKFADPAFRGDREIVLCAVKNRGDALQFANPGLCGDHEVVNAAISNDKAAIKWAGIKDLVVSAPKPIIGSTANGPAQKVRDEKELLIEDIRNNVAFALYHASDAMKDDEAVISEGIKSNYQNFKYASHRIRSMNAIALRAVEAKYSNIAFVPRTCLVNNAAFLSELASNARKGVLQEIMRKRNK